MPLAFFGQPLTARRLAGKPRPRRALAHKPCAPGSAGSLPPRFSVLRSQATRGATPTERACHRRSLPGAHDPLICMISFEGMCELLHTSVGRTMSIWHRDGIQNNEVRTRLRDNPCDGVFGITLAMAVTILAWAGASDSQSKSTAPIPLQKMINRPQHWNLF
jgi:hypothetical protein